MVEKKITAGALLGTIFIIIIVQLPNILMFEENFYVLYIAISVPITIFIINKLGDMHPNSNDLEDLHNHIIQLKKDLYSEEVEKEIIQEPIKELKRENIIDYETD